ncbi:unnamed protein product, partial [Amoebophrya sp. A120]
HQGQRQDPPQPQPDEPGSGVEVVVEDEKNKKNRIEETLDHQDHDRDHDLLSSTSSWAVRAVKQNFSNLFYFNNKKNYAENPNLRSVATSAGAPPTTAMAMASTKCKQQGGPRCEDNM